jgi:hypothetical protein
MVLGQWGAGQGRQAQLHGPRANGEAERTHRRRDGDEGDRHRGARGGRRDDCAPIAGVRRITLGGDKGYDAVSLIWWVP